MAKPLGLAPPKPDNTSIKRQEELLKQQELEQEEAEAEARRKREASSRARKGAAGGSLLTGLETGVVPVDPTKRTNLG